MPQGNGDPSLCLFPDSVTPTSTPWQGNLRCWTTLRRRRSKRRWSQLVHGRLCERLCRKTWPTSYGGRGGTYDYEGSRPIAYPKTGFLWDNAKRKGVSYRTYGEFANLDQTYLSL